MKSFLSEFSKDFEEEILGIIGEYAGFFRIKLKFCVTKRRQLGKIMLIDTYTNRTRKLEESSWGVIYDFKIYDAFQEMEESLNRARSNITLLGDCKLCADLTKLMQSLKVTIRPRFILNYSLEFPRRGYRGYFFKSEHQM